MLYKHQHFVLDKDKRKVFDENQRELRLTGNAYRMLVFLCENGSSTVTEIGDYLDWAKNYNEDHLRQYKYKINTIVGEDIVEYRNGVYSLIGEVRKEKDNRNTNLLHGDNVKSEKTIMEKTETIKFTKIPAIISSILLLLTFLDWSYGYYTFLRVVVTGTALYYTYYLYTKIKWQTFWFWGLVIIAVLFNPIVPVYLKSKSIWGIIDVIVVIFFVTLIIKLKKNNIKE